MERYLSYRRTDQFGNVVRISFPKYKFGNGYYIIFPDGQKMFFNSNTLADEVSRTIQHWIF